MAGIRLHHPTYRAAEGTTLTYVVELPLDYHREAGARDRAATPCATCGTPHERKAIHLRLDANGDVIVAPAIYDALKAIPTMAGMELVNEVKAPPPLLIGAVDKDKERIITAPLNADTAPTPHIEPAQTKYQGRDRLAAPFVPILEQMQEADDRKATQKKREKSRTFT